VLLKLRTLLHAARMIFLRAVSDQCKLISKNARNNLKTIWKLNVPFSHVSIFVLMPTCLKSCLKAQIPMQYKTTLKSCLTLLTGSLLMSKIVNLLFKFIRYLLALRKILHLMRESKLRVTSKIG